jgi:hypothetical protein
MRTTLIGMTIVLGITSAGPARAACVGDCNRDLQVTVDELVLGVHIAAAPADFARCDAFDANEDARVTIEELVTAVGHVRSSCPLEPTATPSPTATPTVPPGCAEVEVVTALAYDPDDVPQLAGVTLTLSYAEATVSIPGSGAVASVLDRLTDRSAVGFFQAEDLDTDANQRDDQVRVAYVTTETIPPGPFIGVRFDCEGGAAPPSAGDFTCRIVDASDGLGFPVEGVDCQLTITD